MAIKLKKDSTVDNRWKPQTPEDYRELLEYKRKELYQLQQKTQEAFDKAMKKRGK